MRKAYFLPVLVFLLFNFFIADAKILRVGYNGIALAGVDFNDITAASTAANSGDTIQIYGSQSGNINKQLVLMGFGYNFDVHPNLQAIGTDAPSVLWGGVNILPGAEGSIIEGLRFVDYALIIRASNVTIKRCFGNIQLYNLNNSINDIKVISSVIIGGGMQWSDRNYCTNFQMFNCIIQGQINFYGSSSNGSLMNCVIGNPNFIGGGQTNFTNAGFLVKNCIVTHMNGNEVNTVWENNFFAQTQPVTLPQGSNNRWGQTYSILFAKLGLAIDQPGYYGYAEFDEAYYKLKADSTAINGGFDGAGNPTDCGVFGGELAYRYVLSGVPAVPAIYKITPASGAATTNPYNVTISVRSNN